VADDQPPDEVPVRKLRVALLVLIAGGLAALLLVRECSVGGGMGGRDLTCRCAGLEWTLYDRRAADGPRQSVCVGVVLSRTCYRVSGGPIVDCPR
jgi:hypothetical protein